MNILDKLFGEKPKAECGFEVTERGFQIAHCKSPMDSCEYIMYYRNEKYCTRRVSAK